MSIPFTIVFSCFTFTSFIHTHNHHPLVANLQNKLAFNLGTWYHKHRLFSISWWCARFVNISWHFFFILCLLLTIFTCSQAVWLVASQSLQNKFAIYFYLICYSNQLWLYRVERKKSHVIVHFCLEALPTFVHCRFQVHTKEVGTGAKKKRFCLNLLWVMSLKMPWLQRMCSFWFWNNINLSGVEMWCCSRNWMD